MVSAFTAILLSHEHSRVEEEVFVCVLGWVVRLQESTVASRGRQSREEGRLETEAKDVETQFSLQTIVGEEPGWRWGVERGWGGTTLYHLPVVPDGAAQHHAEDHPYDLESIRTVIRTLVTFQFLRGQSEKTTHHHCRYTDAHVSDDVELLVEEARDGGEAVLGSDHTMRTHMSLRTELHCHCVAVNCNEQQSRAVSNQLDPWSVTSSPW